VQLVIAVQDRVEVVAALVVVVPVVVVAGLVLLDPAVQPMPGILAALLV
jgi:hypothetical protein